MVWRKPTPTEVRQAISIYIDTAYRGAPPSAIRAKVDTLIALSDEDFYTSPLFEREPKESPARLSLRLGNQHYPHMKLVVERAPDGSGYLFRCDTHDAHCAPRPGSREMQMYRELVQANQQAASAIDHAWEGARLRTFRTFLQQDLERRRAQAPKTGTHGA